MFSYERAFERNLGWVSEGEQQLLRSKRVAIAGLGGVGGAHLLALTRLGIGRFTLADFDHFELHNFNRQVGANVGSIGRPKIDVMAEMALAINPELQLSRFEKGVDAANAEAFLEGADLYVDGLDFFVLDERQRIFKLCAERGIPAITAAPLGMGAALLVFMPGQMTFEEYFRMGSASRAEKAAKFLVGLSPSMLQMGYLVDPSRFDIAAGRGRRRRWPASSAPASPRPRRSRCCSAAAACWRRPGACTSTPTRTACGEPGAPAATAIRCSAG